MTTLVRPIEAIVPRTSAHFGGKATHLAALARAGFPVPAAYALPGEAAEQFFAQALPDSKPSKLFLEGPPPSESVLAGLRAKVLLAEIPESLRVELKNALANLLSNGAESVAVRSSSLGEDQDYASAAGMHTTFLHLATEQQVLEAVRACWASLLHPRVVSYIRGLGVDPNASMAIVVQAMVPAEIAGVLFTVNPLTGAADEMVLNAAYGLGSGVTDGRVSPDTYRVHKRTGWVRDRIIGAKAVRVVGTPGKGIADEPVSEAEARREALDEHTLQQLVELGRRIERHFGDPRDIEWAIAGESIYVLQARPVTAFAPQWGHKNARTTSISDADPVSAVWSNLNVGEALPGVASPLTWSVLSNFSEIGFRKALRSLGCSVPDDAALVGNFRGRIYLNLSELIAIASQVPGVDARTLSMLGVETELEPVHERLDERSSLKFLVRLPMTIARLAHDTLTFPRRRAESRRQFEAELQRIEALDMRVLDTSSLDNTLSDTQELLAHVGGVMLSAYGSLLLSVLLLRAALLWLVEDRADELLRGLLSDLEEVESADPGRRLLDIAGIASNEPAARDKLLQADPTDLVADDLPPGPTREAIGAFLEQYGHRAVREAELSEPRWREDAGLLFAFIRRNLETGAAATNDATSRAHRSLRRRSEEELDELNPAALRGVAKRLLTMVRYYMREREALRSDIVKVLGLFRAIACDASKRIRMLEPECGDDAAFYLTLEELHALLRGQLNSVRQIVRRRRVQYERDAALPDPPSTFVGYPTASRTSTPVGDDLEGVGASGGSAEGPARVLRSASEIPSFRPGEILVTMHADVGWSPTFLLAGAVVTEAGGMLSHASVIAREYGVPAVVNVPQATRAIRSGDWLRVDGNSGLVQVLARAADSVRSPNSVVS
ncbi:MAG: PEP-utilizing enzyme [Proteobacteria bacterium]|nr:PEP-utilizing enzyme [Pseudomonadota bacterium]